MDPLRETARRRPEAPALDAPERAWSYRQLDAAASAVARIVAGEGVPSDARVGFLLPRGPLAVATLHGVPRAGAASVPLHPGWTARELAAHVELVDPRLLLASAGTLDRARAVAGGVRVRSLEEEGLTGGDPGPVREPDERGATHTILATSGTSGRPRAVRLTLENHLACARGAARRMGLSPDDRWLATLSLAHVGGVAMVMRAAVTGARLVLRGEFETGRFHRLVDAGQVTHASLVPTMLRRVLESREGRAFPSSLRGVLIGGDAAPPALVRQALELGMPVHLTYGLTEASSQVATGTPALARRKPGAVGPPLPGVELRVDDRGEILVSGPTVTPGLLPEEASGDRFEGRRLRTGDAGRLDDEGHLHVLGRLSARIVTGGVTVDPAAVEAVLLRHPAVRAAVVVGVPDPEWGERVAALVVPGEGTLSPDRLADFCRGELWGPRRPRHVRIVDEIPRNPNGKADRDAARALLVGHDGEDSGRGRIRE